MSKYFEEFLISEYKTQDGNFLQTIDPFSEFKSKRVTVYIDGSDGPRHAVLCGDQTSDTETRAYLANEIIKTIREKQIETFSNIVRSDIVIIMDFFSSIVTISMDKKYPDNPFLNHIIEELKIKNKHLSNILFDKNQTEKNGRSLMGIFIKLQ